MAITIRSRSLLASIAFACMASLSTAETYVDRAWRATTTAAVRVWRWAVDVLFAPLAAASKAVAKNLPGPAVALIAAKQYVARQVKRERPQLSPSWRMCPSA